MWNGQRENLQFISGQISYFHKKALNIIELDIVKVPLYLIFTVEVISLIC
ncbi:hypothetical protein KL86DYS1_31723 [uncultured Dysgonomonas sp.]|uniref:Uncharacterized protein n=1 Tax=uncultured Dysgonomonas sp. TaxID=206096 RepID=A0A212K7G7_9BACT|nr:hypothetical protein KL86DYS1_31723 [uncultured Dysgonomonas sp.]